MDKAKEERLVMLAEEAGEVVQAVAKILRHGEESFHPADPDKVANLYHLEQELTDLLSIISHMVFKGDVDVDITLTEELSARWHKKLTYTHHQGD